MSAMSVALIALTPVLFGPAGGDDGLANYLKLRHHYGIHVAAAEPALESFVGMRVVEIAGVVNGSFRVNGRESLLLSKPDGQSLPVLADRVPGWLDGGPVRARILVKAYRSSPDRSVVTHLLAAAPAQPIEEIEAREAADAAAAAFRAASKAAKGSRPGFHVVNASRSYQPSSSRPRRYWVLPASKAAPYYAAFIHRENPKLSPEKSLEIAQAVLGFSIKFGVDARLIMAMVMVESDFDPNSTSNKGAQGLGQLMPENIHDMGITNAYDTTENLYGTVRLVRQGLELYRSQTGDPYRTLVLTLAGYNAGDGAVRRHGGVPPYRETQAYVKRVIQLYRQFCGY